MAFIQDMLMATSTHFSPIDFNSNYASSNTILLSGYPSDLTEASQIAFIRVQRGDLAFFLLNDGKQSFFTYAAGVIACLEPNGTAKACLESGDEISVGIRLQDKGFDPSQNAHLTAEISPQKDWYTGAVALVTEQDLTATEDDLGSLIDVRTVKILTLYIAADINDSEDVNLSAYTVPESGGTEYESQDPGAIVSIPLWASTVLDFFHEYKIPTDGHSFVQLKGIAGTLGATPGDLSILISKEY